MTQSELRVFRALLTRNEFFEPIAELLRSEDFSADPHKLIWTGLQTLRTPNQPLNLTTLSDQLRAYRNIVDDQLLASLTPVKVNEADALAEARIVLRDAQRRRLVQFGTSLAVKANEPPDPNQSAAEHLDGMIADAEVGLGDIVQRQEREPERMFGAIAADMLDRIKFRKTNAIMTGFSSIDEYFIGFRPGHLDVLAARYSRGKTALAVCIALNLVKAGHPVLYVTLEMTYDDELVERFVAAEAGVNLLQAGKCGYNYSGDEQQARDAAALINTLPLRIRYRPR